MDGLRKIPNNVPNIEILKKNLGKPLTNIPDPFNRFSSFGEHNNEMLKSFLNKFKFNYSFKSSSELYKSGYFNETLKLILNKYHDIMNIILPTLGKERQKTYSPFLPICPDTGKDFEMYGKDLIESAILSSKILKALGKKSPNGFAYELFLDEKGEKISKSKGNGITIEEWLKYASPESLSLYMYQNPQRAKKLYHEVVPKAVDEYLDCIEKYETQESLKKILNPVWHVHNGIPPSEKMIMSFSMLLNLVGTSNASSKELLWKFVKKYKKNIKEKENPIFDQLINYAIKYFNDVVKLNKKFKKPNQEEKLALNNLAEKLRECNESMSPEAIQTIVYSVGKENGYKENLRDWFKMIYEVIFGDENGPRLGFFISFFGVKETIDLIKNKIK